MSENKADALVAEPAWDVHRVFECGDRMVILGLGNMTFEFSPGGSFSMMTDCPNAEEDRIRSFCGEVARLYQERFK